MRCMVVWRERGHSTGLSGSRSLVGAYFIFAPYIVSLGAVFLRLGGGVPRILCVLSRRPREPASLVALLVAFLQRWYQIWYYSST